MNFNKDIYLQFNNKRYHISVLFLIILFLNIVYYFLTNDYIMTEIIIEAICTTIGLVIGIISISKYTTRNRNLFNYIGISFFTITFVQIINLAYLVGGIHYQLNNFSYLAVNYGEYSIFIIAYFAYKYRIKYSKYFKLNILLSGVLAILLTINYSMISRGYVSLYISRNFWLANFIILTVIYVIGILLFTFGKLKLTAIEKFYLFTFMAFLGIYQTSSKILYLTDGIYDLRLLFIVHVFKYLAYYTIYESISEFLVNNTYNQIYTELLVIEKDREYYNKILSDRMNLLKDLNRMIKKSEGKYKDLINSIEDPVIILDEKSIAYLNKTGLDLLKTLNISTKTIKNKMDFISKFNLEQKGNNFLFSYKDSEGNYRKCQFNDFLISDNSLMILIKDITESFKVNLLKKELENYLTEENLKRDFFTNISHELRTPVNVIFSALQLNDIYINDKNKNGLMNNGKNIKRNCLRLIRTINNFIETNKIYEGYVTPNLEVVNVVELIESVAEAAYVYFEKMNFKFTFDSEYEEIFIRCDKEFLEKIYLNLLSNSVKYGKVMGQIWTTIQIKGDKVVITVKNDTSPMVHDEDIFEIFSKANQPFAVRKEGSGLGLFITKSLTELMGGNILLESREEEIQFILTFDILREDIDYSSYYEKEEFYNINELKEKVDIEFSDIYI